MREFLFTLTYNNLTDKKELNFIVGETSTPPIWNTVKDHATKITRAFDSDALKSRRIYFSATEKLEGISFDSNGDATMDNGGKEVDLSQAGSKQNESAYSKAQAPGIMVPANSYYVFVYDEDGRLVKQQEVTTAGYPQSSAFSRAQLDGATIIALGTSPNAVDYLWRTSMWHTILYSGATDTTEEQQRAGVEVKRGEVIFYPVRIRPIFDWDEDIIEITNYCHPASYQHSWFFRERPKDLTFVEVTDIKKNGVDKTGNAFLFFKSPSLFPNPLPVQEENQTFDLMYLVRPNHDYGTLDTCRDSQNFLEKTSGITYKRLSLVNE